MKIFAVLPDDCSEMDLNSCLPNMRSTGVHYLYLRNFRQPKYLENYIRKINQFGIIPIISHKYKNAIGNERFGIHYKGSEVVDMKPQKSAYAVITASAHNCPDVRKCFSQGAAYVYISTVFKPISKPADTRPILPFAEIETLTACYGDRIVLLGGLSIERINILKHRLKHDFSIAGISMFFNAGHINNYQIQ